MADQVSPTTTGNLNDENQNKDTPSKRTPSKRRSHIERIQEESKEILKNMGIEEISDARTTRRSTRLSSGKSQPPAPVTPPSAIKTPRTPSSSRRGRKKKIDEDVLESTKEEAENDVSSTEKSSENVAAATESSPPAKRPKLSEVIAKEEKKIESKQSEFVDESKTDEIDSSSKLVEDEPDQTSSSKVEENGPGEKMDVDECEVKPEESLPPTTSQAEGSSEKLEEKKGKDELPKKESDAVEVDESTYEIIGKEEVREAIAQETQSSSNDVAADTVSSEKPQTSDEANEAEVATINEEQASEEKKSNEQPPVEAMEVDSSSMQNSEVEKVKPADTETTSEANITADESNEATVPKETVESSSEIVKDQTIEESNAAEPSSSVLEDDKQQDADSEHSVKDLPQSGGENSKQPEKHVEASDISTSEQTNADEGQQQQSSEEQVNQIESTTNDAVSDVKKKEGAEEESVPTSSETKNKESSTKNDNNATDVAAENNQVSCEENSSEKTIGVEKSKVEAVETISSSDEAKIETSQDEPKIASDAITE